MVARFLRSCQQRLVRWKSERDAEVVGLVGSALSYRGLPGRGGGRCAGIVVSHRQRARTGLKAYVEWVGGDVVTAVWFWSSWPRVGQLVVATGWIGWGPHHAEPVFYGHVEQIVPRRSLRRYRRICARRRASAL